MPQAKRSTKSNAGGREGGARADGGLEINEDLRFQHRDWFVQRVGWGILALLVVAALLGLTGSGPLSHVTRGDGHGLTLEYERFVRHGAETRVTLRVGARSTAASDRVRISISQEYLAALDLQRTMPEPESSRARGDVVEFVFGAAERDDLQVQWTFEPDELGRHAAKVTLDDGPAVTIAQFTYP